MAWKAGTRGLLGVLGHEQEKAHVLAIGVIKASDFAKARVTEPDRRGAVGEGTLLAAFEERHAAAAEAEKVGRAGPVHEFRLGAAEEHHARLVEGGGELRVGA